MNIEAQRKSALSDLRELLAEGVDPQTAIVEAAEASGLREDVVAKIGAHLIESREKLVLFRHLEKSKADRANRSKKILKIYRAELSQGIDADLSKIEDKIGISDFSNDEKGELFLKSLDVWLDEKITDSKD